MRKIATTPISQQRHAERARWVLAWDESDGDVRAVARQHAISPTTVRKWAHRVLNADSEDLSEGLPQALQDAPRSGRPVLYDDNAARDLVVLATSQPPRPYALWTHARLAQKMGELNWGVTASWVTRTLARLQLKVHQVRGWIHRRPDPDFDVKVAAVQYIITTAVDNLYPVLSLDEKTAFSVRTPVLADTCDRQGRTRREFEYVRRGTISWYGVQNVATGQVSMRRATARMDSVAFTELLEELIDQHGPVFTLVMDNGSAHTSRHTTSWLAEHPGITVVHTPVHASWVNPIESVFGICARQVLRHGLFDGPSDCDQQVQAWVSLRNRSPRPVTFAWQPSQ